MVTFFETHKTQYSKRHVSYVCISNVYNAPAAELVPLPKLSLMQANAMHF